MKSESLVPPIEAARFFAFDKVDETPVGKSFSSTWQTVPVGGSVPFAKYARVCCMVQFEVSAVDVC